MKLFLLTLSILFTLQTFGQEKFITKSGLVAFEASVPSFEEIKAKNNKVTAILKTDSGKIAVLALVQGFRFKIALMEEHFNESYAESEQYPKTFFLGKIIDFSKKKFRNKEAVAVILEGDFTFHGVTKQIRTPATMRYNDNHYVLSTNFSLTAANYKIKIPKIVRNKIAEDIYIQLFFELYKK
jgi:hypothetical protein